MLQVPRQFQWQMAMPWREGWDCLPLLLMVLFTLSALSGGVVALRGPPPSSVSARPCSPAPGISRGWDVGRDALGLVDIRRPWEWNLVLRAEWQLMHQRIVWLLKILELGMGEVSLTVNGRSAGEANCRVSAGAKQKCLRGLGPRRRIVVS